MEDTSASSLQGQGQYLGLRCVRHVTYLLLLVEQLLASSIVSGVDMGYAGPQGLQVRCPPLNRQQPPLVRQRTHSADVHHLSPPISPPH